MSSQSNSTDIQTTPEVAELPQGVESARPRRRRQRGETRFRSKLPLRVILPLIITIVSGLGLLISDAVVTSTLQRQMMDQIDQQLQGASNSWARGDSLEQQAEALSNLNSLGQLHFDPSPKRPPSPFFVMLQTPQGTNTVLSSDGSSAPDTSAKALKESDSPVTIPSTVESNSTDLWRAISVRNDDGSSTIVALNLEDEQVTLGRLIIVQIIVGLAVLGFIAMFSLMLVRSALKPLTKVEQTARDIANGDLNKRVPQWNDTTEVGQLTRALNRMLTQIQSSFTAVELSEREALDAKDRADEAAEIALESGQQAMDAEANMRRFIGDASHELRTPLTSVQGYAELYTSGATDDPQWAMEHIVQEAKRMNLLVEDLLSLVRMDEGRPLRHEAVDMLHVAADRVDAAQAAYPDRSIALNNESSEVPMIQGDSDRMHQVIDNLITNALKHGGSDADVTVTVSKPDPEHIRIQVSDDGVGISPEDQENIFQRFYRADPSRSRASGGSGLGLAIVKTLVEAHEGTITVDSAPGEGTTFTIDLPAE